MAAGPGRRHRAPLTVARGRNSGMDPFEMVLGIVLITSIAGVINNHLKTKNSGSRIDDLDERLNRIEDLEQRVRALESIVTDGNFDLRRKLDELAK
jgi:hypothetical protein